MKLFKTIVCLFLVLCMLSACSQGSADNREPISSRLPGISDNANIEQVGKDELVTVPIMLGSNFDSTPIVEYKTNWLEYIKNEFKLELKVVDVYNRFEYYDGTFIKSVVGMNAVKGLVYMPSSAVRSLYDLVAAGEVLPLQSILEQNENWNALPEEMKKMYEFEGNIWAIPSELTYSVYTRKVKKDWLQKTGYPVPENLEELYDVCRAFTYEDPDGDGINNTTGISIQIPALIDVFNVFDCRLQVINNGKQINSIAYNEISGKFEDCVNKEEIFEAFEYIKALVKAGITSSGGASTYEFGTYASFQESFTHDLYYNKNHNNIQDKMQIDLNRTEMTIQTWLLSSKKKYDVTEQVFNEYEHITSLDNKKTNPVFYNYSGGFYVADVKTANAEVSISRFIDVFMGSKEAYMTGIFGIEKDDSTYVHNRLSANKIPPVIGRIPGLYDSNYDDISNMYGDTVEQARKNLSAQLQEFTESDRGYDLYPRTGYGAYEILPLYGFSYDVNGRTIFGDPMMKLFTHLYSYVIHGNNSIADGIAIYNAEASKAGLDEYLQEINERIGK